MSKEKEKSNKKEVSKKAKPNQEKKPMKKPQLVAKKAVRISWPGGRIEVRKGDDLTNQPSSVISKLKKENVC